MSAVGVHESAKGANNDAFDVLKGQHREVESLFKQFKRAENENESFELAQVICQKLTVHATIEEEMLYPLARSRAQQGKRDGKLKDVVLESLEEHRSVRRLIADIQAADAGDETLEAKISVLQEQVSHHVDEEEDELFPKLKKVVSKDERLSLGQQLLERAEELDAAEYEGAGYEGAENEAMNETMTVQSGPESDTGAGADGERPLPNGAMNVGTQRGHEGRQPRSGTPHH